MLILPLPPTQYTHTSLNRHTLPHSHPTNQVRALTLTLSLAQTERDSRYSFVGSFVSERVCSGGVFAAPVDRPSAVEDEFFTRRQAKRQKVPRLFVFLHRHVARAAWKRRHCKKGKGEVVR